MQNENEQTEQKGVTVVPAHKKGVTIIDKNTKTENPKVEISHGEDDRG